MKTTSRKRLLVSSVAMLLVAMLALGTATYAWFTSSTTATANGINVKTVKSSKLEISSATSEWGTLINYGVQNKVLLPVSTGNSTAWFTAEGQSYDDGTLKSGTVASQSDLNSYVVKNQLNVHNAGEAAVEKVTISFSVPNDYLRVALVPADAKGENQPNSTSATFTDCVYAADTASYTGLTSTEGTGVEITPKNKYEVPVGTLNKDEVKYYNLYVWFEGQDPDCKDAKAGAVVPDIEFTVTGDTVSEIG